MCVRRVAGALWPSLVWMCKCVSVCLPQTGNMICLEELSPPTFGLSAPSLSVSSVTSPIHTQPLFPFSCLLSFFLLLISLFLLLTLNFICVSQKPRNTSFSHERAHTHTHTHTHCNQTALIAKIRDGRSTSVCVCVFGDQCWCCNWFSLFPLFD